MDTIESLLDELRRSVRGDAWHGPALGEALADVTAAEAAACPVPDAHCIRDVTLHAVGWMEEAARRLCGCDPGLPERGDWPPEASALDDAGWIAARSEVEFAHDALAAAVRDFPPERLGERVGGPERDPALGTGVTFAGLVHGVAQHNAYHAGQVMLLKRLLRAS